MAYKIIFKRSWEDRTTTWEPGCPLMLDAIQVSRNTTTGEAFLQTKFRNLSGQLIESFTATFKVRFETGGTQEVTLYPLDADIKPQCFMTPDAVKLDRGDVCDVTFEITRVKDADTIWTTSVGPTSIPVQAEFAAKKELMKERDCLLIKLKKSPKTHR